MERYLIAGFDSCTREPIIRRMKDGTLICLFLTGGVTEPLNENVVKIARSTNNGKTWSTPEVIVSHPFRGCWGTEIFTECERPFAVVHTYNAPSHYRELLTYKLYLDESGKAIGEPCTMKGHVNGCSIRQGIKMSNGETLFPLYWQEERHTFGWGDEFKPTGNDWTFVVGAGISSDNEHFQRYGYIEHPETGLWEPNAVELDDGHIIMYIRCNRDYIITSESFDYGRTWSDIQTSDIPNPDTKISVLKINGKIIMANNFIKRSEKKGRINLCLAKSDDGKHFEEICKIDEPESTFFYPHLYADYDEKMLYVAYENTRIHKLLKISFDELGI